ncbi:hypothetical protein JXJ21_04515 [candidate division KSB1 bacterium]|nr:hypothetical protein [candidate division KSB1 bacterium]
MSTKNFQIIIGVLIILAGSALYIFQLDLFDFADLGLLTWGTLFILGAIIFLALYFKQGRREFWPFIPASAFLATGLLLFLLAFTNDGEFAAGGMFFTFGLGFLAVYLHQRLREFWPIIPASVLFGISALLLAKGFHFRGDFATSLMFLFFALGFIAVYFHLGRTQFWPFIPAGIFLGLFALLLMASMRYHGEVLAGSMHLVVGVAFAAIAFFHREHWWAFIPGGIFAAVGVFLLLLSDENIGTFIGSGILILSGVAIILRSLNSDKEKEAVAERQE